MTDYKSISNRFFDEVWNHGNMNAIDEWVGPNFTTDEMKGMGLPKGPEGVKQFVSIYRNAFPNLKFTVLETIVSNNVVCTHWSVTGTHKGELFGITPTNRSVTISGVNLDHYTGEKITEGYAYWDALGLFTQLGHGPNVNLGTTSASGSHTPTGVGSHR